MELYRQDRSLLCLVAGSVSLVSWLLLRRVALWCWRQPDEVGIFRTVVVSGAGSGLGRQLCEQLLARGDTVVALDISAAGLAALHAVSSELSGHLVIIEVNVAEWESVKAAATEASRQLCQLKGDGTSANLPCVDAIVNFAGIIRGGPLVEIQPKDMKTTMDVNVLGTFHVNRAFFSLLHRSGPGCAPKIINIASEVSYARLSVAMNAPYSMSKIAIEAYSTSLRQELAMLREGAVPVVVVNPGAMKTQMLTDQMIGGSNQFFSRHASISRSLWKPALLVGSKLATNYMERNGSDPKLVADVVEKVVHLRWPRQRYLVGVSVEMHAARWTPQMFLDKVLSLSLSNAVPS